MSGLTASAYEATSDCLPQPLRRKASPFLALIPTSISLVDVSRECYTIRTGRSHVVAAVLPGSVNDATTFPEPNRAHGSHHWAFERLLSVALVPMTASAFVLSSSTSPVLDGILAVSLVIHSHIGFDSCLVDYLHPRKFPIVGSFMKWTLRAATATVLVGVYQFNTTVRLSLRNPAVFKI